MLVLISFYNYFSIPTINNFMMMMMMMMERIGLAYARGLFYPLQFGFAIRTSLGRIELPYQFGSDSFGSRLDARIRLELAKMRNEACFHY